MEERRAGKKSDKAPVTASVQQEHVQTQPSHYIDPDLLHSITAPSQSNRNWQENSATSRRSANNSGRIVDFSDLRGRKK
jgi:hypothetical protein